MRTPSVLVTGANGEIGHGLMTRLAGMGRPIVTLDIAPLEPVLARLVRGSNAVLIASTDFTHYEPLAVAYEQDRHALQAIAALDAPALLGAVQRHGITMCGPGPAMAVLTACRDLGATEARILRYATSGDTAGDPDRVVGYGAAAVWAPRGADSPQALPKSRIF